MGARAGRPYLIEARDGGALLGGTGLSFETPSRAMTGYVLARDAWGRGVASEALAAIVGLAPRLGLVRLHAHCHVGHAKSIRVLEKGGFVREGVLRRYAAFPNSGLAGPLDTAIYARIWTTDQGNGRAGAAAGASAAGVDPVAREAAAAEQTRAEQDARRRVLTQRRYCTGAGRFDVPISQASTPRAVLRPSAIAQTISD